ncbi:membrane hypothetical protein [metagenome]|uniref:Thiosulfate dehydrogenase [quinone] large subunit n=1 Tax=metagenome TaxID=256318 RepID=A0A2P2C9H3_9ZZZZ
MVTMHRNHDTNVADPHAATGVAGRDTRLFDRALAALRIGFGLTFLWAFFDKLLALGFGTGAITDETGARTGIDFFAKDGAWLNGGNPTKGFLTFGVPADNPLQGMFNSMAGDPWVNVLFMAGLLGVGLTLTLGIGMKLGTISGALMYAFMWIASWPLANNPVIDDHLLGVLSMIVLGLSAAGMTWGLGRAWSRTSLVRRAPILQ